MLNTQGTEINHIFVAKVINKLPLIGHTNTSFNLHNYTKRNSSIIFCCSDSERLVNLAKNSESISERSRIQM